MKKLMFFIGILITAISFISCSSDNNDNPNIDNIIGKWRMSQLFVNSIDQELNECEKKMTIEVFENGSYTEKDFEYNETLTECMQFDLVNGTWEYLGNSMYKMSGLNTPALKVTFDGNKIIIEYSELSEGITLAIKTIFIADGDVVADQIIGNWGLDQEFNDGEEIPLSDCDKMETFEFLEDGFFFEQEFEDNETSTDCIESTAKTRLWKNIGNSTYILYKINDYSEEEVKITFDTDKMTVELSLIEGGVVHTVKLIFIKVSS